MKTIWTRESLSVLVVVLASSCVAPPDRPGSKNGPDARSDLPYSDEFASDEIKQSRSYFLYHPNPGVRYSARNALLQTPEPINRFPDFVRDIVARLRVPCPTMGKNRIGQTLARAGLAHGVSTVGRWRLYRNFRARP